MADVAVTYTPEAEAQLVGLYRYIAAEGSPLTAKRFTDAIVARCETLDQFPERGIARDDIRAGLRTLAYRRVVIVYAVEPRAVTIIGVFYGGQDYAAVLGDG